MGEWKKTGCVLCAQNCGLEALVEGNRIVRVRPDKANPRSEGYVCRKGLKIPHYQRHAQRLRRPLERSGDEFREVSWEVALDAVAEKLRAVVDKYGPRSVAYMGGGGQGCHFEAAFGVRLLRGLGSRYHYSALAQELTGMFWVQGRAAGRQYLHTIPDERRTDFLLCVGWNPWMSHQAPQARKLINEFAADPDRTLAVIDPRRTETAKKADLHLPIRPGTDALLTRAMIAVILKEGWENRGYIAQHVSGFEKIPGYFEDFDAEGAARVCGLDYGKVREVAELFAKRRSSLHADLGTLMGRHSTLTSYLQLILLAICGRIGVPGGNVFPGHIMPLGAHSDERSPETWRTVETDFPAIMGVFPPNVLPEEILSGKPDRVRAVIVSGSNPLRSYADTTAYEKAFRKLDLLVTVDVALSETAALSHYVLPARSAYEKWDAAFFAWTWPGVYFQMRRPVVKPEGEPLEEGEIFTRLAERLGLVPEIPEELKRAAAGERTKFAQALFGFIQKNPAAMKTLPFVLARTLGPVLGSANLAALWGMLQNAPKEFRRDAAREGFGGGLLQGEELYRAILDHPEGLWIGRCDMEKNLEALKTEDGRVNVHIPELEGWLGEVEPEAEERALAPDPAYPLVLMAGRHYDDNANTLMRDPAWNEGRRGPTLQMHPEDALALGLIDGQRVRVRTEAGEVEAELEVTGDARPGHVSLPHGFGLVYDGRERGPNVNRLTKNTRRDRLAGTPLHRYVPCRVSAA